MTTAAERVFIDASVFIAAAGSASGGSALVLDLCQGRRYAAVCSQRVLLEAQTNIREKLDIIGNKSHSERVCLESLVTA